ncbi:DsbA family oxidoreductase [Paraconexibacter antarcticus]|uniref:DsbA family oxidoreductase n=1 Tax=Paraconexibacter antarcticus TaxID=2949664 RepID=A0ABY5DZF7_9ACTN|nr:DsbA family oxidoreductase [Paraconexibacter antarcticus]UTI66925.1 DsbA family oxidoreductase [Paraconexibacter antarcticus]
MNVEIWSDIACPWCYVGKRRFEAALERFEHRDAVTVTWRSFELDPNAPAERTGDYAAMLARKYGMTPEEGQAKLDEMTAMAAGDGLDFHFERLRSGNTFDGHRLLHLSAEHGLQDAMKERLMRAYLTEGELMSDHETLVRLGTDAGLDSGEVRAMLASDRFAADVRADEETAYGFGVQGVPFFVVDRAMGASGAHPPEQLLELLRRGWAARAPEPITVVADGDSCGVDGC